MILLELACAIAKELALSEDQIQSIGLAGLIHDIGKINVPAEILAKPSKIDDNEFSIIKAHPKIGHDILKKFTFPGRSLNQFISIMNE